MKAQASQETNDNQGGRSDGASAFSSFFANAATKKREREARRLAEEELVEAEQTEKV